MKRFYLIGFIIFGGYHSMAQVGIRGPVCIIPGLTYQYIIDAKWDSSVSMKACITGGKLNTGNTCTSSGTLTNLLFITWGESNVRKIDLTSSTGNASLAVLGTVELNGGQINDSDKVQIYKKTQATYLFRCNEARGGACAPSYFYQWQKSENGLNWTSIEGATGKDLQFSSNVFLVNTFFRRVATEPHSNMLAYSNVGVLTIAF